MNPVRLSRLAAETSGRLFGEDVLFNSVSTDTRSLHTGQLFVALKGPSFDGNLFVEDAMLRGAAGALVQRRAECDLAQVQVADTRAALGSFARYWRGQFDIPVIGITGSNGKTTIKEMTASILRRRGPVLATRGNLNNDIGVPVTLLEISQENIAAVIELGANHPGEIGYLANIAMPDIGVVSNAGPAHLEGFGSIEGVARAKGELFAALGPAGAAVLNADDRFAPLWRSIIGRRQCVSFGLSDAADLQASGIEQHVADSGIETRFRLTGKAGECLISMPFAGQHNVRNALAAAAAAWSAGASLEDIRDGLAAAATVAGRLQIRRTGAGATLIDDTYNANPGSLVAALQVQKSMPGKAWLVLGDMGELGEESAARHAEMGEFSRRQGVTRLFATGEMARHAVAAFGSGAQWFPDSDALSAELERELAGDVVVLIKASRAMHFERIVDALSGSGHSPRRQANGG